MFIFRFFFLGLVTLALYETFVRAPEIFCSVDSSAFVVSWVRFIGMFLVLFAGFVLDALFFKD